MFDTWSIHPFIHSLVFSPWVGSAGTRAQTGMALARCILGRFLGVGCHCFPPPLDVPTSIARCLHVRNDERDPSSERWNCGRECPVILPKWLPRPLGIFYMPQIYDMGPTALLHLNPQTWVPKISTLPLDHRSRLFGPLKMLNRFGIQFPEATKNIFFSKTS
jgi:hypothetical protein